MLKPKPEKDEKTGRFVSGNIGAGARKARAINLAKHSSMIFTPIGKFMASRQLRRCAPVADYVKVVASILPRDLNVEVSAIENRAVAELNARH
jgi:hypothetical protein